MNTRKMIAAVLRTRATFGMPSGIEGVVAAMEPATFEEQILQALLEPISLQPVLSRLADVFDPPTQEGAPDGTYPSAAAIPSLADLNASMAIPVTDNGPGVAQAAEATIRILDEDEIIQAGDEWRLRDGLHHRDGRPVEWRPCGGSVGGVVSDYPDSIFRRH